MVIDKIHPIRYVALQTGLTPHLIRAWERRYGAVDPDRTPTNRRLYSDADISRLRLLQRAVQAGHTIAQLATLPSEILSELVGEPQKGYEESKASTSRHHYEACLSAVMSFDKQALDMALTKAERDLNMLSLMEQVVVPLLQKIGDLWAEGSLKTGSEHMASSVIRSFLGDALRNTESSASAPKILITTPKGQMHELGALIAATVAETVGWQAVYLGPNLPAEEIAAAAEQLKPKVIALSIVHPVDDPHLIHDIKKMGRYLNDRVSLIVGGRAARSYEGVLKEMDGIILEDMSSFRSKLESLWS